MPIMNLGATDVDALLTGLLVFALRATVLLAAAWLATNLMRKASAATRHLVWTVAIFGVLALPLLSASLPAWNVPMFSATVRVAPVIPHASQSTSTTETVAAAAAATELPTSPRPATQDRPAEASRNGFASRVSFTGALAMTWATLALILLARLAIANVRVSAWQRSSRRVEDGRWLALLQRLERQYGIERPVVLLEHAETDVPVTWGVVYPVILLPASAAQWDEEQRVAVLTHELAHVKRFDALTQLLAQLALALLWFHPLVWMAARRMRLEREHACDDFVLLAGARASRYADDLLGLARRLARPVAPAAAALAMARRSELEGRLLAILDPAMSRSAVRRARVGLLVLAVLTLAMPLAAFQPAARLTEERPAAVVTPPADKPVAAKTDAPRAPAPPPTSAPEQPTGAIELKDNSQSLEMLMQRVGIPSLATTSSQPPRLDTLPPVVVDMETLVAVTQALKTRTSDYDKGVMLAEIAKRYQSNDALREAYLDVVFSMTSDHERSKALLSLLSRDSMPASSTARILKSAALMTSDASRGTVLKSISPATLADTAVQRAYVSVIVAMTSDYERGQAIQSLLKQRPLTQGVQLALLRATAAITSSTEKGNVLALFIQRHGLADDTMRRAFLSAAESLTSDHDYRRVMSLVIR
jgi:beta-lactamase regulating signal transducer with metallopeptidase domain